MEPVTYKEFMRVTGTLLLCLIGVLIISSYKFFTSNFEIEYAIISITSLASIISVGRLGGIAKEKINGNEVQFSQFDKYIRKHFIIIGLAGIGFYLFLYKGLYGAYQLIENFSFFLLVLRIVIIIVSFRLIIAISKIQTVYNSLESEARN